MGLYREDFILWVKDTINKVTNHKWTQIDFISLLKELLKLEQNEKYYLVKDIETILYLLLKHKIDKESSIDLLYDLRRKLQILLERSPSMECQLTNNLETIYKSVRNKVVKEMNVSITTFNVDCPYSIKNLLDLKYFG